MKKLVLVAVGAILLLGVVAVGAILLATGGDLGDWNGGGQAAQATGPTGGVPAPVPVPPPGPTGPSGAMGYPPGPRKLQLTPGRVKTSLSEPLAACFRQHPLSSSKPAVLELALEAQARGGGFAVLDVSVKAWGGASKGLVECAAQTLRGQVIPGGGAGFTPGDRATFDLALEPPPSVQPPPKEPPPSTLPATRQQPPSRRGGSR